MFGYDNNQRYWQLIIANFKEEKFFIYLIISIHYYEASISSRTDACCIIDCLPAEEDSK